jgi:hypothetical protein
MARSAASPTANPLTRRYGDSAVRENLGSPARRTTRTWELPDGQGREAGKRGKLTAPEVP